MTSFRSVHLRDHLPSFGLAGLVLLHGATFGPAYEAVVAGAHALTLLPIFLSAWIFGVRDGLLTLLAYLPGTVLLLYLNDLPIDLGSTLLDAAPTMTAAVLGIFLFGVRSHPSFSSRTETPQKHEPDAPDQNKVLKALINNLPQCIYVKDAQSRFVVANEHLAHLVGYDDPDELVGKTDFDLFPEAYAAKYYEDEQAIVEHGEPKIAEEERTLDCSTGEEQWALATKIPIFDEEENVEYIIGMTYDITEQKQLEQELRETREKALAAARAKSQFLANMSHEIRTPMNGVLGFADLLADTSLTAEQQDYVESIQHSGDTLLSIIDDILDFSKMEAGEVELETCPVRVQFCIETALDSLATKAVSKGLEMVYLVDDDVPSVILTDETRLQQVLLNLLSNAVKFTEEGEVVLRVRRAATPDDPDAPSTLHFSVRDTGIGIPEEKREKLFESFSQADASTTRTHGGTGLGLSISKQIVEAMNGEMWVESEVGEGSTFHFTIQAEPTDRRPSEDETVEWDQLSLEGRRALIVDNNETNRALLTQLAERWGMEATATTSGAEALDRLEETDVDYDVALLDVEMPEMDGHTLLRRLRGAPDLADLPVIMLSSMYEHASDEVEGKHVRWLYKPIKHSALFDAIAQLLESEAAPQPQTQDQETEHETPALRVLLAEDEVVNRKMTVRMLEKMGHTVETATDGDEAVQAAREERFDVILMDLHMPNVDGLEATRRIRDERAIGVQVSVIALTAAVTKADRDRCREAGMDGFLSKPLQQEALTEALNQDPQSLKEQAVPE